METLEQLREKYNKLSKERNTLFKKILELENQKTFKNFTVGNCYLDTWNNSFKKIIAIDCEGFCSICINEDSICREFITLESTKYWEKITSEQFKDVYLAVMKDIQDPDLDDKEESNWDISFKSVVESIDKEK